MRFFFTAVLMMLCAGVAFAQDITITGVVTDESTGDPVGFASVVVKGTSNGTNTDIDGNYSITAPADAVLQFIFLGYQTLEIPVNGKAVINAVMAPDSQMLEGTVVVGYGTAKKISSVVGSASSVSGSKIQNKPAANVGDALQGQVAGLSVLSSSGEPMSTLNMRIRGVNSISSSNEPLIILDGSPVSSSVFLTLSGNDIESVAVLKDASSTAIYGSRAANGVIYVTTKKGKRSERAQVQLRAQYGVSSVADQRIETLNTDQWFGFLQRYNPTSYNGDKMQAALKRAKMYNIDTDWKDYFFNDAAPTWSADLNVSGATDKTDYFVSASAFSQDGTLRYSDMQRMSLRSNINVKANNWLKLGANIQLTYQQAQTSGDSYDGNNPNNPMLASIFFLPWISPYEIIDEGNDGVDWHYGEEVKKFPENNNYNPYYLFSLQPSSTNWLRLNGNTYLELNPIEGLVLRASQALEGYDARSTYKCYPYEPFEGSGVASESFSRYYQFTFSNTAEYKFSIANDHHIVLLAGQESIIAKEESFGAQATGITDIRQNNLSDATPEYSAPSWGMADKVFNSYFGRVSYDYADKYFLDVTFRTDGASVFGANSKYANFYSIGGMWNISRENFMAGTRWVEDLKLKASWGTTGNSGLPGNYLSIGYIGNGSSYDGNASWGIANPSNADLTWETVRSANIGLSARLFNFMNASVEFYDKYTSNMLMSIPYSYTTGHAEGYGNIGEMQNTGVDVELSFDIFNNKDWYINLTTNFNYNRNRITKLFAGRDEFIIPNTGQSLKVGHQYGEFFTPISAGVDPRDGYQMWYDLDGNVTKEFSEDYAQYTGKSRFAPFAGGVQLNVQWKNLALSMDWAYVVGKYLTNNDKFFVENPTVGFPSYNLSTKVLEMWYQDPETGEIENQYSNVPRYESNRQFDSTFLEDASFLRLKNVQLTYTFPERLIKKSGFMQGLRIYVSGRNLLTFTKYSGWDPEVDSNVSLSAYPNSKQITAGVEISF